MKLLLSIFIVSISTNAFSQSLNGSFLKTDPTKEFARLIEFEGNKFYWSESNGLDSLKGKGLYLIEDDSIYFFFQPIKEEKQSTFIIKEENLSSESTLINLKILDSENDMNPANAFVTLLNKYDEVITRLTYAEQQIMQISIPNNSSVDKIKIWGLGYQAINIPLKNKKGLSLSVECHMKLDRYRQIEEKRISYAIEQIDKTSYRLTNNTSEYIYKKQ
ncbi:hypothetical protein [Penaeicola halotolerans]|uniref:hypothetical protein n=1 Tax=Penaeicola halotolerans TaxID=2793196 RepID=UPI001CF838CE|nr:hypothetical protein [Penaeicola halotolerans]